MVQSISYAGNIPTPVWFLILSFIALIIGYVGNLNSFKFIGWILFLVVIIRTIIDF